jgi:hypothetical protein
VVRLVEIEAENAEDVAHLRVSPAHESYIDGVAASLEEAAASPEAGPWYRAVYVDDTPVGFVMLSIGDPPTDERYPSGTSSGAFSSTSGSRDGDTARRRSTPS